MATGHTHPVIDGEITTLSEFAYECSKSFVWSWRDGNELAYPRLDYSYYKEGMAAAMQELEEWDNASEEQRYALWSEYANEVTERHAKAVEKANAAQRAVASMLVEVQSVNVPETHENFKQFMIDQLQSTLESDGCVRDEWHRVTPYCQWSDSKRGQILETMAYYAKNMAEAAERNAESRAWISTLARIYNLDVKEPDEV